jgi:hypothetical protein
MSVRSSSIARQVLQTRALQCSFSSVFHLRRAGMNTNDANYIENLFIFTVGVPIALIGVTGAYCYITNTITSPLRARVNESNLGNVKR